MISRFFTKTATQKRLNTTNKTLRTLSTIGTVSVSDPQPKTEQDLLQGLHITKYHIYAAFSADIDQNDILEIDGNTYTVLEKMPHRVLTMQYLKLITSRD